MEQQTFERAGADRPFGVFIGFLPGWSGIGRLERRLVAEHAAWRARGIASAGSRRLTGARANIKPYPLPETPAGKLNGTDPDSRNLKTTRGWVQGYNAQAAVTPEQIVIAAEISTEVA